MRGGDTERDDSGEYIQERCLVSSPEDTVRGKQAGKPAGRSVGRQAQCWYTHDPGRLHGPNNVRARRYLAPGRDSEHGDSGFRRTGACRTRDRVTRAFFPYLVVDLYRVPRYFFGARFGDAFGWRFTLASSGAKGGDFKI
jgi:hypothetical protein